MFHQLESRDINRYLYGTKDFDLSLDELNITIVGYEDTAQLIPINAYYRLLTLW